MMHHPHHGAYERAITTNWGTLYVRNAEDKSNFWITTTIFGQLQSDMYVLKTEVEF